MRQLRLALGLALIPLCAWLGSFIPVGTGSGIIIGLVLGIILSYLFLTYGPGRKKNQLPTSYYLNRQHEINGGYNEQAIVNATLSSREAAQPNLGGPYQRH
ncbi:MAG TPA: hypothetical protein VJ761_11565 [Ktedonobacteraceae bacterium]|nr:hypothetical protein [Ktedonobacteraceae bacterium]